MIDIFLQIFHLQSELESVIANANLKAESDKKEIEGYKVQDRCFEF